MNSEWNYISSDGVLKKKIISYGNNNSHPFDRSRCKVKFIDVSVDGGVGIDYCPSGCERELTIGESETLFDRVLARAIQTMVCQEVSLFELRVGEAFFSAKMELVQFHLSAKPLHCLNEEEKFSEAEKLKERASALIKENRYEDAVALLRRAFRCVCWAGGNVKENGFSELYFSVIANLSLCSLKLNENERTVSLCSRVLEHRPNHVKCLLRRATALDSMEETERAKKDALFVLTVEPNNKSAEQLLEKIKTHIAKQKMDYSVLVKKMLQVNN